MNGWISIKQSNLIRFQCRVQKMARQYDAKLQSLLSMAKNDTESGKKGTGDTLHCLRSLFCHMSCLHEKSHPPQAIHPAPNTLLFSMTFQSKGMHVLLLEICMRSYKQPWPLWQQKSLQTPWETVLQPW